MQANRIEAVGFRGDIDDAVAGARLRQILVAEVERLRVDFPVQRVPRELSQMRRRSRR